MLCVYFCGPAQDAAFAEEKSVQGGKELMEPRTLDELINDINQAGWARITHYICLGVGVSSREESYENLRVERNREGKVALGVGHDLHYIGDNFEIEKKGSLKEGGLYYEIREEGILMLELQLRDDE